MQRRNTKTTIGQAIRISRTARGLTLQELGNKMGVSRASLSKIELSTSITFRKLREVASVLDMRASDLVLMTEQNILNQAQALDVLRDVVECGYLKGNAFQRDEDEMCLFDDICQILGEDPTSYKEQLQERQASQ